MRRHWSTAATLLLVLSRVGVGRADGTTIVIEPAVLRADALAFDVRLDTDAEVAGTINDIVFDPAAPIRARENGRPDCVVNDAIEKGATRFAFLPDGCAPGSCTAVRAILFSIENVSPIPSGSILYTCALAADTPPGHYALQCANPGASNPAESAVTVSCADGEVDVAASTVLHAESDSVVHPGDIAVVDVRLFSNEGAASVAVDLSTAPLPIGGISGCATSDNTLATFDLEPDGCTRGVDCTAVHAELARRSGGPFASGLVLFACGIDVPVTTATGEYAVRLSNAMGGTETGGLATMNTVDGEIRVAGPPRTPTAAGETPTPGRSSLTIGSARGAPGERVEIAVRLHTDEIIGGTQNDLHFSPQAAIAVLPGGIPDCTPDPSVDWIRGPEFAFGPPQCVPGIDCTAIRALILTRESGASIPDGTVIYRCRVAIDPGATGGPELTCDNVQGTTPDGRAVAMTCSGGRIDIVAPSPVRTATAVPPPPTLPSGSDVASSSGGGGCAIDPSAGGGWWLLVPLLFRRR